MCQAAFLFPGQGSQAVGMGEDFYEEFSTVKEIFDMAETVCRLPLKRLCFNGPMGDLTQTVHLQPALTVVNLAILEGVRIAGVPSPGFSAGHSLGEYSALFSAGVVSAESAFALTAKRGALMHEESLKHAGAMSAVLGLSITDVTELTSRVRAEGGVVSVANHNSAEQIVITGSPDAVKQAALLAQNRGAKAIPLKVSGAWHSELIAGAQDAFTDFIRTIDFQAPSHDILFNVTAETEKSPEQIQKIMGRQFSSPVKWYDAMQRLISAQTEIFAEIGPGRVLTGLMKKILPENHSARLFSVNSLKTLEDFAKQVA